MSHLIVWFRDHVIFVYTWTTTLLPADVRELTAISFNTDVLLLDCVYYKAHFKTTKNNLMVLSTYITESWDNWRM